MRKITTSLLSIGIGSGIGIFIYKKLQGKEYNSNKTYKFKKYYELTNEWLKLKNQNILITKYFESKNIKTIAIYGMGELGIRLYEDLKNSNIDVKYGIDECGGLPYTSLEILTPDSTFDKVDAIVVTAIFAYNNIKNNLNKKTNIPVISLEDIIFGL